MASVSPAVWLSRKDNRALPGVLCIYTPSGGKRDVAFLKGFTLTVDKRDGWQKLKEGISRVGAESKREEFDLLDRL